MKQKKQGLHFGLSRIAVLLIYVPFFAVQCFFNYSNITQGQSGNFQTSYKKSSAGAHAAIVDLGKNKRGKQVVISLNKRFEPANAPSCDNVSFEIPVYFTKVRLFNKHTHILLASFHLHAITLRGPPAIV